jgi:osmotically-inducible protein OsmY
VTLKGAVQTQAQADRAVSIAKVADGVKEVRSELSVKGGSGGSK